MDKDDVRKLFVLLLQQYEELPLKDRKSKVLELFEIINHKISSMGAEEWETSDSMRMYQEIMDLSEDNILYTTFPILNPVIFCCIFYKLTQIFFC